VARFRKHDEFSDLEARLRGRRAEAPSSFVRQLAARASAERRSFRPRTRLVLAGALISGALAASASAGVIGLADGSATHFFRIVRKLTAPTPKLTAASKKKTVATLKFDDNKPADKQYANQCGPTAPYQRCTIEVDPDAPKITATPTSGTQDVDFVLTIKPDKVTPVAPVTIQCTTEDGNDKNASKNATAPEDYNTETETVTIPAGETTEPMDFPGLINADTTGETGDESFFLSCTSPDNSADIDKDDQVVTITIHNEPGPPPKPAPPV